MTDEILDWFKIAQRDLPWRHDQSPYRIWLSEIILQQTRVKQGLPYYERFVKTFPNVYDLARASEDEVLKLWQGLGYYSRARNLHHTAKKVVNEHHGIFPKTYKELKKLRGIGDYTASAIASICYGEPVAALDGNVFRVLSRFLGIDIPINSTEGRKIFKETAEIYLNKDRPGDYNQAIMEFGATQCKPKKPLCQTCPLQKSCVAFQQERVDKLPVKLKKTKVRTRYFNYLIFLSSTGETLIQQRTQQDIWQKLYEFPLVESSSPLSKSKLFHTEFIQNLTLNSYEIKRLNKKSIKHQLTHQQLWVRFWLIRAKDLPEMTSTKEKKTDRVPIGQLHRFPVPALIAKFLQEFDFSG